MRFAKVFIASVGTLPSLVIASPLAYPAPSSLRTVYQFPNLTWIENMVRAFHPHPPRGNLPLQDSKLTIPQAIRSNGQILATNLAGPELFLVDPSCQNTPPPVVHCFPNNTATFGIAELEPDLFYVASILGNLEIFQEEPGSAQLWEVDMRSYNPHTSPQAAVRKVTDIPGDASVNGLTALSVQDRTLLAADSGLGVVYRFNATSGANETVIDDPLFKPVPNGGHLQTGVNGLRVVDRGNSSELYFSSTNQGLVGIVPISRDGKAIGPSRVLGKASNADDFDIGVDGSVWVAQNVNQTLTRIFPNGTSEVVLGAQDSDVLNGPVSARFGRTEGDKNVLYVSTDGFFSDVEKGIFEADGKIVVVETVC